ncbi:MAG: 50S ribosomal protein L14 [Candidatus Micrarchaeota archaeon]|nr:50S ribosomal protein L14 [Candidatus Micrarchaeota archaeon]
MKGLPSRVTRGLTVGSRLVCDDNSGAKIVAIIGVIGTKGRHGSVPSAGVGDTVIVSVKKGTPQMRKKIERGVIVRQRREFRRPTGYRIMFEDNALVLIDDKGLPKGTEIKGAICREVAERFPKVAAIAAAVV